MANPQKSRLPWGALLVLGIAAGIGLIAGLAWWTHRTDPDADQRFGGLMNSGRAFLEAGDAGRAVEAFQQARAMNPANPDIHVNLAIAYLRAGQPGQAALHAGEATQLEPTAGAGHYLLGCALLRQNQYSNAVQALQTAKDIDRTVNAVSFQLGRAYTGWGRFQDASDQFSEVTQFETNHPSAHYQLAQMLLRLGQKERASEALANHQKATAGKPQAADDPSIYERCVHTVPRAIATLEQPDPRGIPVRFSDQTASAFGEAAARYQGPLATLDVNRRGWNDLVVIDGGSLRLLWNSNGVFSPRAEPLPLPNVGIPRSMVAGDINNDRYEDLVVCGDNGIAVIRSATNGILSDATRISNLGTVTGPGGVLIDHDFTGKLGFAALTPKGGVRLFRGFGNLAFRELPTTSGIPSQVTGATAIAIDDWNNDDLPDLLLTRAGTPPAVLFNQRGSGLSLTNQPTDWPVANALANADLNNDLRTDIALATDKTVDLFLGGLREPRRLAARGNQIRHLRFIDYDNDGWQDLIGWGADGIHVWRNRGRLGFEEVTGILGLGTLRDVRQVLPADFDQDGDTDFVVALESGGIRYLRNDGGDANHSIKIRLLGNRSNSSGLGTKVEVSGGSWRTLRTIQQLPIEIGVGKRTRLDSVTVRWFDTQLPSVDVAVEPRVILNLPELTVPTGSCPYLFAWDGTEYRFITDLLGAAPAGLPAAPGRYIEADPEELVRIGTSDQLPARKGRQVLQVTEELREILYLDALQLVTVDHAPEIEVHTTSKLMPGRPFPPHRLIGLHRPIPLRSATTLAGTDVTPLLTTIDGKRVSPTAPHGEAYRGLAEPHGVILRFESMPTDQPIFLVLDGWLRFGGGMANIAASHRSDFGFPFPVLEAELPDGSWKRIDVTVGAPAGKTKSIVADLTGRLPNGTQRLRLTQSFEIHWDRIALLRPAPAGSIHEFRQDPIRADLHARGYSAFANLPASEPLTPIYSQLLPWPNWRSTPSGWATRPGDVRELLRSRDQGLAIIAGGDELTLEFETSAQPVQAAGTTRTYFLWSVGWDKDADYHVAAGTRIEPLPWSGMDDQRYGVEPRPAFPSDALHAEYNTRWVGPRALTQKSAATAPKTP
jgi:Flp pilus assembly protein TadD